MSDNSFDAAQKALRNRAVVDLEEPLPDEQPTRWWLRIVVLLVFFVFGAIVWLSWQDNAGDGEPVLVQAPPGPIKGPPDDPGGMSVPNDGSEIATVLSGERDEPPPVVGPAPNDAPPARPQAPPPAAAEEIIPPAQETAGAAGADATGPMTSIDEIMPPDEMEEAPAPAAGQVAPAPSAPTDTAGISATPLPPLTEVPNLPSSATTRPAPAPAPMPTPPPDMAAPAAPMPVVPPVVDTTPVVPPRPQPPAAAAPTPTPPAPVEPEPETVAPPAPPSPPQPPSGGPRIQVGSLRDEADAITAWERVARRNPDVFKGRRRVITSAEVKGATYYRAQLEGFASKAEAQEACAAIKRNGNDCLVVAR